MTVDHAAQGRRNRSRGHAWEVECARYLSDQLDERIVTARFVSGGRACGVDLVTLEDDEVLFTVGGWSLECKTGPHAPTPWLRQAETQAQGRFYAVLAKRDRKPTADALVYLPMSAYVEWWTGVTSDDDRVAIVSLAVFAELLQVPTWEEVGAEPLTDSCSYDAVKGT